MPEHDAETRGKKITLASNLVLDGLQVAAYFFTNVLDLLAQALEMLSDVFISAFLLLSAYWSRKGADEFHMLGHGRVQNVVGFASAQFSFSS
jgi:divalent metal cation (Fe/Co/Zn/Cd) transporter